MKYLSISSFPIQKQYSPSTNQFNYIGINPEGILPRFSENKNEDDLSYKYEMFQEFG